MVKIRKSVIAVYAIFLLIIPVVAVTYDNPDYPKLTAPEVTTTTTGTGSVNASNVTHNDLAGLQGGTSGEYYHTTSAQQAFLINQSYGTYNSTYALWAYNQSFDSTPFMKYNWTETATTQTSLLQTSDIFSSYTQLKGMGGTINGMSVDFPAGKFASVNGKRVITTAQSISVSAYPTACGHIYLNESNVFIAVKAYDGACSNSGLGTAPPNSIPILRWQTDATSVTGILSAYDTAPMAYIADSGIWQDSGMTTGLAFTNFVGHAYIRSGWGLQAYSNSNGNGVIAQSGYNDLGGYANWYLPILRTDSEGLSIRGKVGQTASYIGIRNSSGINLFNIATDGSTYILGNLTIMGNGYMANNLTTTNLITSQFNLTDSNGKMVSGLFESNRRFLSIIKENSSLESFIYIVDRATQSSLTIFPNETLFPIAHFQKGNSPTECSVLFSQSGQEDVCMNNGTKVIDTGGTIRVGNLEVTSSIDTVYLTATSSINGDTVSATNGVSGSTGSFSTLTYSSSDPEAFGMLNITQSRFLTLIRASCTPQYAGAIWNYFNGSRMFYVKPSDCNLYKKVITVDGWEDYIDSGIDLRPIGDKAPCYNTNVIRTTTNDQFTNETITKEVPILPYNKIKEVGVTQ